MSSAGETLGIDVPGRCLACDSDRGAVREVRCDFGLSTTRNLRVQPLAGTESWEKAWLPIGSRSVFFCDPCIRARFRPRLRRALVATAILVPLASGVVLSRRLEYGWATEDPVKWTGVILLVLALAALLWTLCTLGQWIEFRFKGPQPDEVDLQSWAAELSASALRAEFPGVFRGREDWALIGFTPSEFSRRSS
jgi:hypothetical protein